MGGWLDTRILSTEHSYNYKLRATWLTPEVIRATARLAQVRNWLSVEEDSSSPVKKSRFCSRRKFGGQVQGRCDSAERPS